MNHSLSPKIHNFGSKKIILKQFMKKTGFDEIEDIYG